MSFSLLRSLPSPLSCVLGLYSNWVELSNFLNTLQVDPFLEKIVCVEGLFERGIKGSGRLSTGWKAVFKRGRAVTPASSLPNCLSGKQLFLFVSRLGPQHDTVALHSRIETLANPFHEWLPCPQIQAQLENCILPEITEAGLLFIPTLKADSSFPSSLCLFIS